jgi:hypothetical protein
MDGPSAGPKFPWAPIDPEAALNRTRERGTIILDLISGRAGFSLAGLWGGEGRLEPLGISRPLRIFHCHVNPQPRY